MAKINSFISSDPGGQEEYKLTTDPGVTGQTTSPFGQAEYKPEPTTNPEVTGHTSNTADSSGQAEYKLTTDPGVTGQTTNPYSSGQTKNKPTSGTTPKKEAITDLYMQDGDDYTIDDNAFSNAQMGTGDNSTAASVAGSSSGESGASEVNSNVNTGVFGGPSRAAHPGYSLW